MGRLTELFTYLNAKDHPTAHQIKHQYHYIIVDKQLKKIRREYQSNTKGYHKQGRPRMG